MKNKSFIILSRDPTYNTKNLLKNAMFYNHILIRIYFSVYRERHQRYEVVGTKIINISNEYLMDTVLQIYLKMVFLQVYISLGKKIEKHSW